MALSHRQARHAWPFLAVVLAALARGVDFVSRFPGVAPATTSVGGNRRRRRDARALGRGQGSCYFLRPFGLLPCDLWPLAGLDADAVHRARHGAACRHARSWPRPLGHPQCAGGTRPQCRVRCHAGHAAHGLSGSSRDPIRLRTGAGNACHLRLCAAADGALHHPRAAHRAERHSRSRSHGGLYATTVAVEGRNPCF